MMGRARLLGLDDLQEGLHVEARHGDDGGAGVQGQVADDHHAVDCAIRRGWMDGERKNKWASAKENRQERDRQTQTKGETREGKGKGKRRRRRRTVEERQDANEDIVRGDRLQDNGLEEVGDQVTVGQHHALGDAGGSRGVRQHLRCSTEQAAYTHTEREIYMCT